MAEKESATRSAEIRERADNLLGKAENLFTLVGPREGAFCLLHPALAK